MYRTTGLEIGDRTTVRDVGKWRFRPLVLEIHLASLALALLKERGYMEGWGKKQRQLSSHSCHVSQSFAIVFAVIWWGEGGVRQRVQIRLCFSVAQSLSNVQMRINNRRLLGMKLMVWK